MCCRYWWMCRISWSLWTELCQYLGVIQMFMQSRFLFATWQQVRQHFCRTWQWCHSCEEFRFLDVSVALNVICQFLVRLKIVLLFNYFWFIYQLLVAHVVCIHVCVCVCVCVCAGARMRACIVFNNIMSSK